LMIFFTGFALYSGTALLPLLIQSQFGYDATLSGLVISPGGLAIIFLMPLAGKLTNKVPSKYLILFGVTLLTLGMWHSAYLTPDLSYRDFVWIRITQIIGLPFLFIPISILAFKDVPKELSSKGSALYSLSRNLGGSMGIALVIAFVTRHQQIRQSQLAGHLTATDFNYRALVADYTHTLYSHGHDMLSASQLAVGRIYQELLHQAAILAYSDAFIFMSMIGVGVMLLTLFLPYNNPRTQKAAPIEAH